MNNSKIESIVERVSEWSKEQLYLGYNKHDGLNSPVLNVLLGWSKWSRIIAIQIIMRAPINLRPFFLIRKTNNEKNINVNCGFNACIKFTIFCQRFWRL